MESEEPSSPPSAQSESLLIHQAGGILQGLAFAMQQPELASLGNALVTMSLRQIRSSPKETINGLDTGSGDDDSDNGGDLLDAASPEADD